jgi:amino acid adenylation domain-containing protein
MSDGQPRPRPPETTAPYLPRRFEQLAADQPRAPLLVYGEWRLAYRDVNTAANRLAHRLIALGVGRNVPVGLCLDRGPDLVVAILAVLKAGGAYVPLDPQWPADRLRHMRAASSPAVLITRSAFLPLLAGHLGPVLDLDRDQPAIALESGANPAVPLHDDQWCYVLFTSGSTGQPKGVPVTHGNLSGLFPPLTAALALGPADVWTWFHSASFGFSVWELWGALLHGSSLVIVPEHIRQDPLALGELIAEEGVTVFSQTPSAFRRVLHEPRFHASIAASGLRYLALSGEAIRRDDLTAWFAHGHAARLINTYAITETAGQLTLRTYQESDATEEGARNLGRPLAGREVLVLDAAGRPVSAGEAGELWVGGACVTPGYLAAPELADRFSAVAVPGAGVLRGYRTGDRVRRLADGALEYLGRVDAQLKFRGYRIEPGDIESALRAHPGVRDAAAGLRADPAGNQRLTAWVVAGESAAVPDGGAPEFWPSLGAYGIYDQWLYGLMNAEPVRLAAYRAAFAAAVPGKVVLDIGTGEDAVLARLCVEAGAAHVYAVEVLEPAARRARELVHSLRLQDRITVLTGDIADLDLPRPVEVCTQGIIGNIGSADGIAGIWNAARRHFAPECVPVPERCVTRIAALELPAGLRADPGFGLLAADYARRLFAAVGQPFDLRLCLRNVGDADLLTGAADFEVLDFHGALPTAHAGEAGLLVTRDGLFDGCLLWTVVTAGAGATVDYFREQRAWLPVYLPLADAPVPVRRGDRLHLAWRSVLESDARFPDYSVTARLAGPSGPVELTHVSRHRGATAGGTALHRRLLDRLAAAAEPPTVPELRRWLEERVPPHLVPQSWVFLPELLLGPGGKLDRGALPAPDALRPRLAGAPVAPRSRAERALAALWTTVLGFESLGVEDDFFELGGDSITAVQLTTRLQRWLDAGVPLAALFEAPTIAGLAGYLEQYFPAALAAALDRAGPVPDAAVPVVAAVDARVPLTFSQQSLWFLQQLYPGDTSASEQFAIRLRGPLDAAVLERAWQGLLERHAVLAATVDGEGMVPGAAAPAPWRTVALADEAALTALGAAELREPFDLAAGPLVRPVLGRLAADNHVLLVTAHHIVADGLSVPVLQADLARLYGGGAALPPAAAYGSLAGQPAWQQGLATPEALDWWRERLAQLPPEPLAAFVRPPASDGRVERRSRRLPFTLEPTLADGLRRLARDCGATPYMVLLAAFRTLLARLTGENDLGIGTPMTLRDGPELRDVVGCLVNPVVLRVPVDPRRSFAEQVQAERAGALETFPYRTVPFSRVVEALAPDRQLGMHPLFQILFSWEPAVPPAVGGGVEYDSVAVPAERASYFDLECALRDAGEGAPLTGYFAWSTIVLEDMVARQLPDWWRTLLADALARPAAPVGTLALLPPVERRRLLVEWNATAAPLPAGRTLHAAFLARAARTPEALAVRAAGGDWTCGELADRSGALAAALVARGVTGRNVGIAIGRSPELVLAVLGALRAGATVVPLDPGFPPTRLAFMAGDAELALALVQGATAALFAGTTVPVLDVDVPTTTATPPATLPAVGGDAPAMMLYTSGSTGEPKGALTTHESAVSRCHWMWTTFGFGSDEVFALRTSLNFIDSWWEIFGALGHGALLQVVPDDVATDPLQLPAFLAARGVTQIVLVPSLLRALLEALQAAAARPALRWCITSGEPLAPELVAECRRLLPGMTVLNTYGTSEIWDATAFDTRDLAAGAVRVPIGRPVANARVYVLDGAGEPVPPGVPGELQVAGLGVGPGYWRRPALNAEKFVRQFLRDVGEERLYRTGDRARFLPDGTLECLGRLDAQFKLRGQRIEPAEIEQLLATHPEVAAAVVGLAGEGEAAVLVAGFVRADGAHLQAGDLARALEDRLRLSLPAWMVPTAWRELAALPLTPTGKVDRRGWLAGAAGGLAQVAVGEPSPPRSGTEEEVAALWSALLGRERIGRDENFFALGGHSLLAARLLTRIRSTLGVTLELRTLFAAPTVAGLAGAIEAQQAAASGGPPALLAVPARSPDPVLSFGQERLWFLEQLDPGSPAYNVAWTIRCRGPLPVPALRIALDALVERHAALRMRFPAVAGRPVPVADPAVAVPLPVIDLTGATDEALAGELARLSRGPFDLARGPLFRATLLTTGPDEHHLLFVAQHIVTDATSNHVLFADLVTALTAALDGTPPAWPPLTLEYGDFARRQRGQASAPRLRAALDWWRQRLAGAPPALELPADRPRPAEQRFAGASVHRAVPASLAAGLQDVARARAVTPYMVLLAAFKALLHRWTGAVDLLVGTPVEGRLTADVEQVVGLFINTLVMRTDLSGDPSFATVLERVRETTLDAQSHQEVPFEQLVELAAPERSLARSPVFQVMFNLVQLPERTRRVGALELRADRLVELGASSFDLTLTAASAPDGLTLTFEYATDLFDAGTVEQLADGYLALLQAALADPGQALSRLPIVDATTRARLLRAGQADALPGPTTPVQERVRAQAARTPEAVAVRLGDTTVSYAELEARACRLAHHLVASGVAPGARVGICLPRVPEYLVAVLAVLKAGGTYVPLDPDYPAERLGLLAGDAALSVLIVNGATRDCLSLPVPCVDPERDPGVIDRCPGESPSVVVPPDATAYLLYTSGSTGRPKGVLVSHASLAQALAGWEAAWELAPGEPHLQMASAAFDVFTGDWVRALCTGGSLVLCPRDALLDPPALLRLLRGAGIRVAEFVPAVIRLLLDHCRTTGESLPALRLLIVGSDSWYGSELEALRRSAAPGTRLINSYGVAEATIDSSWYEASTATVSGPVPIGRPFPGVALYVLDERAEPVPARVPGELCIGGAGVAIGYWNDAALTAAKFGPAPHASTPGARLYRTGDRARWNSAGQLELLGRVDDQFKLRGFRIEPAEIEACLTGLPGVAAAAVGLQSPAAGEPRLAAWLVPRGEPMPVPELQRELRQRLPAHLVPTAWAWLDALPLTPNGKVDRAALRTRPVAPPAPAVEPVDVAPATELEATIGGLCAGLLGVDAFGPEDDFFRRGGHSLLAARLVARLREALQREVPLRLVFDAPTPRGLAAALDAAMPGGPVPTPAPRSRQPGAAVPLSAMQQRLWFLERLRPGTAAYHLHWLLRLDGPLDRAALQAAVDGLVARHEVLRTAFTAEAGIPAQVIRDRLPVPVVEVPVADPQALIAAPFDLAAGPLLRVTVIAEGPQAHRLLIVLHHLIADGWSFQVLGRDLAALYDAALRGCPPELPALPLQYADYALWQQDPGRQARLSGQLEYWRGALAGAPPLLRLPGAEPAIAAPVGDAGAWQSRVLPAAAADALRALALDRGCTLFMVLLAAFQALLARRAGLDDVLVGTPVAGRSHRALEDLIGFFVNTLVIRTRLDGGPTFAGLLGRVREASLRAFEHADVPFEKLVEVLKPRRSLAHSPLCQVLFALHNQPQQPLALTGLRVRAEAVATDTVKFDLNLHVAEEAGTLRVALAWRTGLYSAEVAGTLLDQYVALLAAVADGPHRPLADLLAAVPAGTRSHEPAALEPARHGPPVRDLAPLEATLQEIWFSLLGGAPAGLDEDFFALGGHSLLATRLVAAIEDRLGLALPLVAIFEAPTIRGLAARLAATTPRPRSAAGPIPRLPRRPDAEDLE